MAALLYAIEANENISNQRQGKKNTDARTEQKSSSSDAKKSEEPGVKNDRGAAGNQSEGVQLLSKRQIGQRLRHLRERIVKNEKEEQWRQEAITQLERMREQLVTSEGETAAKANVEKQK